MSKLEGGLRERVRFSSLVDWPVYPRLRGSMTASTSAYNVSAGAQRAASARTFPFRVSALAALDCKPLATAWHPGGPAPVLPRTHNVVLRVGLS